MPIPNLTEHGLLPPGIHDCTLPELKEAFGNNRWAQDESSATRREVLCPHRRALYEKLERYLEELRGTGLVAFVLVNGSFVTDKPGPNDIDLVVVLSADHDFSASLSPRAYDLLSKRRLRQGGYPFDVLVVADGGNLFAEAINLFRQVRDRPDLTKGLLRLKP